MSILLFLFLLFLLQIVLTEDNNEYGPLIFSDNFEGEELDPLKWDYYIGKSEYDLKNIELQYFRKNKDNIYIKDNKLHIKAKIETFENMSYTSAKITTKNSFQFSYGYLETSIKLPRGKGIIPYFMLIGENIDDVSWPKCGQMNLIELRDENCNYNSLYWKSPEQENETLDRNENCISNINEFHKFSLKWTKDDITMYLDNNQILYYMKFEDKILADTFQKSFFLTIKLSVGGENNTEVDNSTFPLEMIIDYIKIYQLKENNGHFKYSKSLAFFDDFDEKELNTTRWTYTLGNKNNGWGTFQKQFYTNRTENLFLENSMLHIKAIKENEYYGFKMYTSAKITTQNSLNFTYGEIRANISFPSAKGISAGLYLSGTYFNNKWPECGEIDALIAVYNSTDQTTISSGTTWGRKIEDAYYKRKKYNITKFNEYSIIWDKQYITVYIEDLEIYKIEISSIDLIAFHRPFFINLNILVGGTTVENDIDNSVFPLEMIVDYIKVYHYDLNFTYDSNYFVNDYNYSKYFSCLSLLFLAFILI